MVPGPGPPSGRPVTLVQLRGLDESLYGEHLEKGLQTVVDMSPLLQPLVSSLPGTDQPKSGCMPSRAWPSSRQEPRGGQGEHGGQSFQPSRVKPQPRSEAPSGQPRGPGSALGSRGCQQRSDHHAPASLPGPDDPGPGLSLQGAQSLVGKMGFTADKVE